MYFFIVNPQSRSKKGQSLWAVISSILENQTDDYEVYFTEYAGHATKLAHQITSEHPDCTLVAVGGDGTIHEVMTGITNHETITFGYIPSGSGNDFARGMGISNNIAEAVEHILHPTTYMNMDVCCAKRDDEEIQRFGVSCSIGFDAGVCYEVEVSPLKSILNRLHLGKLTYALLAVKQVITYKAAPIQLEFDGKHHREFKKAYFAAAFNQKFEGGGVMLAPNAKPDDGCIDVLVVEGVPRIVILCVLPLAFWGLHKVIPGVHLYRCKNVNIQYTTQNPVHLDGDPCGMHKNLYVAVDEKPLKVIIS